MLKQVMFTYFKMHDSKTLSPSIAVDEHGCYYDRRVREFMANQTTGTDLRMPSREALAALRAASHSMRVNMDRWLERHGLSEGRMGVLFRLSGGPLPLGDLANALDVSPRNITGLVDHLEEDGLVERVPDPEDRRSVRARVTTEGQKKLDAIRNEMHQARDTIVGNFTDEELIQLRHLSLKLVQNMYAKEAR